jgi:hypothetical protein
MVQTIANFSTTNVMSRMAARFATLTKTAPVLSCPQLTSQLSIQSFDLKRRREHVKKKLLSALYTLLTLSEGTQWYKKVNTNTYKWQFA